MRAIRFLPALAALVVPAALFAAAPSDSPAPDESSLAGQFLIATPEMQDPRFRHTVLVMVRHSKDGAFGIVINRPLGEQPFAKLLDALGEKSDGVIGDVPLFAGGPVQPELGFVLHSVDYSNADTVGIGAAVALTASPGVFRDIAAGKGPAKSLMAFGYAGWAAGQLEGEIARKSWFTAPLDARLVFDEDRETVWDRAMERRTRDL